MAHRPTRPVTRWKRIFLSALTERFAAFVAESGVDRIRVDWHRVLPTLAIGAIGGGLAGTWRLDFLSRGRHGGDRLF